MEIDPRFDWMMHLKHPIQQQQETSRFEEATERQAQKQVRNVQGEANPIAFGLGKSRVF